MTVRLRKIALDLARGALIACQTDTIWGFSCHPLHPEAIRRLLALKQRPLSKGLILLGSDWSQFAPYLDSRWLQTLQQAASASHGRPTTWIVPAATGCPPWLCPDGRSLALRRTAHPLIDRLTRRLDSPLISTSANRSGQPVARNRFIVERRFGSSLDHVIGPHETRHSPASRIIDLQSGWILRP
jgi:L-threonylcarbamoyladenylate synthase